jgi:hypothetical protein
MKNKEKRSPTNDDGPEKQGPAGSRWVAVPNTKGTYFDNPFRTDPSRISPIANPGQAAAVTADLRKDVGISVAKTNMELLRRQKGFENLRASNALPSSTEVRTFTSGDSVNAIFAKVKNLRKDFVRAAACPEGIERLRMLSLVALDAYQPPNCKFDITKVSPLERGMFLEAKNAWESLCSGSELSDIHYRRRATENLIDVYNETLKMGQKLDKAQQTHYFDSYRPIDVPTERRKCEKGLDGWFDVPRYATEKSKRGLGPGECWCYEETIGPGGMPVGEVVKRLKPTAGQYVMRAWDFVAESQSSTEFTGALLGTAIGCALSAAFRPYSNAIGEETAERLVMLKRINDFPKPQKQREQLREHRDPGVPTTSPYFPKNAGALETFAKGLSARLDKNGRVAVEGVDHGIVGRGLTVTPDGSGGITILSVKSKRSRTPGTDSSKGL